MKSILHGKINVLSSNEKRRIVSKSVGRIFYQNLTRARKERQIAPQASTIQISDFRIIFFYNPHSAIGNPHFGRLIPIYMNFSNYLLATDDETRGVSSQSSGEVEYVLLCKGEEIRENILSDGKMLFSATS